MFLFKFCLDQINLPGCLNNYALLDTKYSISLFILQHHSYKIIFLTITIDDNTIQTVLNASKVGNDFFIDAHINNEDVTNVKKCKYQISK